MLRSTSGQVVVSMDCLVGARGPVFIVPKQSGTIVPNGAMGTGAGMVVSVNVQARDVNSFGESKAQIAALLASRLGRAQRRKATSTRFAYPVASPVVSIFTPKSWTVSKCPSIVTELSLSFGKIVDFDGSSVSNSRKTVHDIAMASQFCAGIAHAVQVPKRVTERARQQP